LSVKDFFKKKLASFNQMNNIGENAKKIEKKERVKKLQKNESRLH